MKFKRNKKIVRYLILFSIFFLNCSLSAQQKTEKKIPLTRVLFVFDASNSMAGLWESDVKINIARKILINMIDSLQNVENVIMALRVYGHQSTVPPQDCSDTRLEVPFGKNNASVIRQRLRFISPKGTTPIANSLAQCADDFPPCDNCRNIVILISDGIEACDGDPCAVSNDLQKRGIVLKPFIIGIGIDEGFRETFDCIGHFYNAVHEDKFKDLMNVVVTQALNSTTAQINLLDEKGLPTETNVNMTFYDRYSGKILYNYVHSINNRGNPDTLVLDPLVTYRVVVHTLPEVYIDSLKVVPGKHTIAAVDAPQGYLLVTSPGLGNLYRDISIIVRKSGDMNTLNVQKMGETAKYLKGKYDIEIPVLPRIIKTGIDVSQSSTTTVEIARPGLLTAISSTNGYGSIYVHREKKLEWIYNFNPLLKNESVTLQPGKYTIVFRSQNAKQSIYTISKTVEIKSGSSVVIELY